MQRAPVGSLIGLSGAFSRMALTGMGAAFIIIMDYYAEQRGRQVCIVRIAEKN